ncbi:DGQHR domain-containing protein [Candidatus Woesearchaeota archaeon]|nr:DGQHR domain-containing protein [Candidatus Woesearchaeota archaeon]
MEEDFKDHEGPFFFGLLLRGIFIEKQSKQKAKLYHEESIHNALREEYSSKGWYFHKQQKNTILMRKDKKVSEQLEDNVWMLFKKMEFLELNKDNHFSIKTGSSTKQIDVFAKDEHNVFVIFCTSQENMGPPSNPLKPKIREVSDLKRDICQNIYNQYGKKLRISFIFVTKNILWDPSDEVEAKDKNIIVWKEEELEAYHHLVEQLGSCAKYQMYAVIFAGKEAFEVSDIKVPALRGGIGKKKYYCFVISPEKLFQVAYVHRREKTNIQDVKNSYQRMVSKHRLDKIKDFVEKGNSFYNNIILSFKYTKKKKIDFKPHSKKEDIENITYGILTFPPYYGCAWIIDGQHRLYGYSKSDKAKEHTIPVVAFENLSTGDQANLFVDINKEQSSVSTALLWDLYPDIYDTSEIPEHQKLRTISLISKSLNTDKSSLFFQRIKIPSVIYQDKKQTNLTLTNLCDGIKDNRIIEEDEGLLFNESYENTVNYSVKRINAFFETVNESLPGDWEKGDRGLIRTNVGLRIFFKIFRMLLKYLEHAGDSRLYKKNDLQDFKIKSKDILQPVFSKIKKMDGQEIDTIRSASNQSMVLKNSQMLLWDLYDSCQFGAELWKDGRGYAPPIPGEEDDENIKSMVKETEIEMKNFILKKLNSFHKDQWWAQGIPEGVKQNIVRNIENSLSKVPYKRREVLAYPNEKKFLLYSSTSDLKEVIKYSINWKQFAHLFGDVDFISARLKSLEELRNAFIGHEERKEEIDEIQKNLGYWETKWIRRCIGLDPQKTCNT